MAGWGIPVRYLCVILLPVMTNIVDYVAAAPYLYSEPLAIAMCATGPWDSHGTAMGQPWPGEHKVPASWIMVDML